MPDRARHLWGWLQTPPGIRVVRYTMVSATMMTFSLVMVGIVYGVLRLWSPVPCTIFANVTAVFPSYWLHHRWTWGKRGRSHVSQELLPFWVLSAAIIAFSAVAANAARSLSHTSHMDHLGQTILVLSADVISFAIFWLLELVVFNRSFRVHRFETA